MKESKRNMRKFQDRAKEKIKTNKKEIEKIMVRDSKRKKTERKEKRKGGKRRDRIKLLLLRPRRVNQKCAKILYDAEKEWMWKKNQKT